MYRKKAGVFILLLLVLLVIVACVSLAVGQIPISFQNIIAVLCDGLGLHFITTGAVTEEQKAVIWFIRMPRLIVGILVGCALGISGAVMQGVFSNPLADPGIIGVSSGASMGAVIAIALGASADVLTLPLFAFVGALFAVMLTVLLAMKNGKIPVMTLLLAGVAVGMFLSAVTSGVLTFMNEQKLHQFLFWMVGGLDYRRWEHVYMAVGPIIVGSGVLMLLARHLNILVLGDTEAKAVGMHVLPFRMGMLAIAALTTAASVCVSGNIGFVGLVVPHMMRMFVGPDHRVLLPAAGLAGAAFLVICDTIGRAIVAPTEIRVGIMTAIIGTPYFLYLLRRLQKDSF
jgi:iron complex transport system permease protein